MSFAPVLFPDRDDRSALGRPKRSGETYYVIPPGWGFFTTTTSSLQNGIDRYSFWYTPTPLVIDQLAVEVTTGSAGNMRIGFYRADRDWQPIGAPLADSGNIDTTAAAVKTYTPGTPIYVPRGRYVSVHNADNAAASIRVFRGLISPFDTALGANYLLGSVAVTRAYAAFPTPGTAWDTETAGSTPMNMYVVYRVSTP